MGTTEGNDSRKRPDHEHIDRVLSMIMHHEEVQRMGEALKEVLDRSRDREGPGREKERK